ncbi:MAG: septal ring lytic transglycosylase RlpA family protein [Xenococcaceae cyanobacterium MO_188.B19]|nr:septal ring lytic transglycosylase RlpA family protein [Xenococcaceae cyanobacterium MO_188.B19]
MINKKTFSLATSLVTLSANVCALTLLQLPTEAQSIKNEQNNNDLSVINKEESKTLDNQILAINLESSEANQLELDKLNSVASPQSEINLSPTAPTQIARTVFNGRASWYGPGFHGRRTANGEIYNSNALTAAHRTLAFGTRVRVTNINNGRSVIVRINDRGPFIKGRIIDVSAGAARRLNMISSGVAPVRVEILGRR